MSRCNKQPWFSRSSTRVFFPVFFYFFILVWGSRSARCHREMFGLSLVHIRGFFGPLTFDAFFVWWFAGKTSERYINDYKYTCGKTWTCYHLVEVWKHFQQQQQHPQKKTTRKTKNVRSLLISWFPGVKLGTGFQRSLAECALVWCVSGAPGVFGQFLPRPTQSGRLAEC